jgi:hypothetical protein
VAHVVLLADLPEARWAGVGWYAFEHQSGSPTYEWAVHDVRVARYPAAVSGAPVHIRFLSSRSYRPTGTLVRREGGRGGWGGGGEEEGGGRGGGGGGGA